MILQFHRGETDKRRVYGATWIERRIAVTRRQYSFPALAPVHTPLRGFRVVSSVL